MLPPTSGSPQPIFPQPEPIKASGPKPALTPIFFTKEQSKLADAGLVKAFQRTDNPYAFIIEVWHPQKNNQGNLLVGKYSVIVKNKNNPEDALKALGRNLDKIARVGERYVLSDVRSITFNSSQNKSTITHSYRHLSNHKNKLKEINFDNLHVSLKNKLTSNQNKIDRIIHSRESFKQNAEYYNDQNYHIKKALILDQFVHGIFKINVPPPSSPSPSGVTGQALPTTQRRHRREIIDDEAEKEVDDFGGVEERDGGSSQNFGNKTT
jgi:hypothetical protein